MLKPSFQPIHDGSRVRPVGQLDVVAFEGFNKALGHPVALGALHRSRDWFKAQGSGKGSSITCDIARPDLSGFIGPFSFRNVGSGC